MTELFDIPETKSPRLLWVEKHGVKTKERDGKFYAWDSYTEESMREEYEDEHGDDRNFDMISESPKGWIGIGATEDDAIVDWAKKNSTPLWNEEQL